MKPLNRSSLFVFIAGLSLIVLILLFSLPRTVPVNLFTGLERFMPGRPYPFGEECLLYEQYYSGSSMSGEFSCAVRDPQGNFHLIFVSGNAMVIRRVAFYSRSLDIGHIIDQMGEYERFVRLRPDYTVLSWKDNSVQLIIIVRDFYLTNNFSRLLFLEEQID